MAERFEAEFELLDGIFMAPSSAGKPSRKQRQESVVNPTGEAEVLQKSALAPRSVS